MRHNPRECWCGIDHSFKDPTERVEATTTPEGAKGWETVQARHSDTARGHGVDVAPDAQPEDVRAETRRTNDGDRGEPSNAPTAALALEPVEAGSDDELSLRGVWLSRMMFGPLLDPALAYREDRSYEGWLAAQGLVLA